MGDRDYNKRIFDDEFNKPDDYKLFKVGLLLFVIMFVVVGSIWTYMKNIEVQEEQKKIEANKLAWQQYQQSVKYQQQQQEYQQKYDEYNKTIPIQIH